MFNRLLLLFVSASFPLLTIHAGPCPKGRYGVACEHICSSTCRLLNDIRLCDQKTGQCSEGCIQGFHGDTCSEICTAHCVNNTCNFHNGRCSLGCTDNYRGDFCDQSPEASTERNSNGLSPSTVAAIVLAVVVVILIVGIVVYCVKYKKGSSTQREPDKPKQYKRNDVYAVVRKPARKPTGEPSRKPNKKQISKKKEKPEQYANTGRSEDGSSTIEPEYPTVYSKAEVCANTVRSEDGLIYSGVDTSLPIYKPGTIEPEGPTVYSTTNFSAVPMNDEH